MKSKSVSLYVHALVYVLTLHSAAKTELWPPRLRISSAEFRSFPHTELQKFLKTKAIPICGFFPNSQNAAFASNPGAVQKNEQVYMVLYQQLSTKNLVSHCCSFLIFCICSNDVEDGRIADGL